jgi:hypothetical protein
MQTNGYSLNTAAFFESTTFLRPKPPGTLSKSHATLAQEAMTSLPFHE